MVNHNAAKASTDSTLASVLNNGSIRPSQIALVHEAFQVSMSDFAAAQQILSPHAQAVFQHEGAMLEPATHLAWAQQIGERAKYFGVQEKVAHLQVL